MSRTADQPGTFRVSNKPGPDGKYRLSGVRLNGSRLKIKADSLTEAYTLGQTMFGGVTHRQDTSPPQVTAPGVKPMVDDFGLPIDWQMPAVSKETIADMAPPVLPGNTGTPGSTPNPAIIPAKDLGEQRKNAESLAQLFGVGYAAAVVRMSTTMLEKGHDQVPKPDPKQAKNLVDNFKKAITQTFGDTEVGPWTMVILLTFGIPISMWIQAKPKVTKDETKSHLQSV